MSNSRVERNSVSSAAKSSKEKKLKLFGVELDPSQLHEMGRGSSEEEGDESVSSSSPSSTVTEKLPTGKTPCGGESPPPAAARKKFECSCCFKVFANSQALGGHQNAHKNERMRQKRLQLQARKASCLDYYINPFLNKSCDKSSEIFVNFYDPSSPHLNREVNISFGSSSVQFCNNYVSLQQNKNKFSLIDGSRMKKSRPIILDRSPSSHESKRICSRKGLDLQLGLGK